MTGSAAACVANFHIHRCRQKPPSLHHAGEAPGSAPVEVGVAPFPPGLSTVPPMTATARREWKETLARFYASVAQRQRRQLDIVMINRHRVGGVLALGRAGILLAAGDPGRHVALAVAGLDSDGATFSSVSTAQTMQAYSAPGKGKFAGKAPCKKKKGGSDASFAARQKKEAKMREARAQAGRREFARMDWGPSSCDPCRAVGGNLGQFGAGWSWGWSWIWIWSWSRRWGWTWTLDLAVSGPGLRTQAWGGRSTGSSPSAGVCCTSTSF